MLVSVDDAKLLEIRVLRFTRPKVQGGALLAYVDVELLFSIGGSPSGLIINRCSVFQGVQNRWVELPLLEDPHSDRYCSPALKLSSDLQKRVSDVILDEYRKRFAADRLPKRRTRRIHHLKNVLDEPTM